MIIIRRLSQIEKSQTTGGAFYSIAMGIGILVSTVSSLVCNAVACAKSGNNNTTESYAPFRRTTMMRLSPVPSRSSITVF